MFSSTFAQHLKRTFIVTALATASLVAHATPTIANGGFETTSLTGAGMMDNTNVSGWTTTSGYTFIGLADQPTALGYVPLYDGQLDLWKAAASPVGGNFLASDASFLKGAESTLITGLVAGTEYTISFWQAAAQQIWRDGATDAYWDVRVDGGAYERSTIMQNTNHGFVDWMQQTVTFTASGLNATLDFLAGSNFPAGSPPFALLDGVTITETNHVPEPGAMSLMGVGLLALARGRRKAKKNA